MAPRSLAQRDSSGSVAGPGPREATPTSERTRQVSSVQRALVLLRMFVNKDDGWSVTEAARALGVDKSAVSRLLATLAAEGFVLVDAVTRRYYVGPAALMVGNQFAGASWGRSLDSIIRALADQADATAQLGMLEGTFVRYLVVEHGTGRLRVVSAPGERRLVHCSAMGKAMIAGLGEQMRDEILDSIAVEGLLPEGGPRAIRDPVAFREDLVRVQERGYSTSIEEGLPGVAAMGMRAPSIHGYPLAVGISLPVGHYAQADHALLVQHLREAVDAIHQRVSPPGAAPSGL